MEKENLVQTKSYEFALDVVGVCKELKGKGEFIIGKQLLRSGTSVGANIEEAIGASSKKDFLHKINISYKEARETKYWIRLLMDSQIIDHPLAHRLLDECEELLKIIGSIRKTTKGSIN